MNDADAQGVDEMKETETDVAQLAGKPRPKPLERTEDHRIWD